MQECPTTSWSFRQMGAPTSTHPCPVSLGDRRVHIRQLHWTIALSLMWMVSLCSMPWTPKLKVASVELLTQ